MKLNEALKTLKGAGYIVEDAMHDRAMARVDRAYQHETDLHKWGGDPMALHQRGEEWEEGGHAEWTDTDKAYSDSDEKEDFCREVAEKLIAHFKPIYAKKGYTAAEFKKEHGTDNNWDWAICQILERYLYHASYENEELAYMDLEQAVEYMKPKAAKVLARCWSTKWNWLDPDKYRYER